MPRRPAVKAPPSFSDHDRLLRQKLEDDFAFAAKEIIRVKHRDRVSEIVPLAFNSKQARLHNVIERVRALNVYMSLRGRGVLEIAEGLSVEAGGPLLVGGLIPVVEAVAKFGVTRLLRVLRVVPSFADLHDGPVWILIGKDRRGGISTYVEARFLHAAAFRPNTAVQVTAHTIQAAQNVFGMARSMYGFWPNEYARFRVDAENEGRACLRFGHEGGASEFSVQTAGGKDQARSFGFDLLHLSEYAQYEDYAAVAAAVSGAPKHAWIIKETTARGAGGPFFDEWRKALTIDDVLLAHARHDTEALDKWNGQVKFFLSWREDEGYRLDLQDWERKKFKTSMSKYEYALMERYSKLTYEQIKWRRQEVKKVSQLPPEDLRGLTPEQFVQQEFPSDETELFQATSRALFDPERLAAMLVRATGHTPCAALRVMDDEPQAVLPSSANFFVFRPPVPGHSYVIGGDVSQGKKQGDWTVFVVLDQTDGTLAEEVALWRGKIDAQAAGDVLTLIAEWYNEAYVICEVNGPGLATVTRLRENGYSNMYHRRKLDLVKDSYDDTNAFLLGFHTTSVSKTLVCDTLALAIRQGTVEARSVVIVEELRAFENREGKYTAPDGRFDDCVIALALAHYGHTRRLVDAKTVEYKQRRAEHERTIGRDMAWYENDLLEKARERFREAARRNKKQIARQGDATEPFGWLTEDIVQV